MLYHRNRNKKIRHPNVKIGSAYIRTATKLRCSLGIKLDKISLLFEFYKD